MTIDELLKVVEKKVTKEEFQAFKIEVEKFFQNYQAMLFYLKPETGIPIEDLNKSVQDEINKIKNAYMIGNAIQPEDLPSNIATKSYVNENTQGRIYPAKAKDVIDEVVVARGDKTSLKEYIDLHCKILELITKINSLSEGQIDKSKLEPHNHNEHPNRDAEDCHPQSAITNLETDLASKVSIATAITDINSTEEVEAQIDKDLLEPHDHNDLTNREMEGCHPQSAIDGLVADLYDINTRLDEQEEFSENLTDYATQLGYQSFLDMIECLMNAMQNLLDLHSGYAPPCWRGPI